MSIKEGVYCFDNGEEFSVQKPFKNKTICLVTLLTTKEMFTAEERQIERRIASGWFTFVRELKPSGGE